MTVASENADAVTEADVEQIRDFGLFGGLRDDVLRDILRSLRVVELPMDTVVYEQGRPGRELFVILRGAIEIACQRPEELPVVVRELRVGEWFGEMALLDLQGRLGTAKVTKPVRLLRLTAHDLDALYRRDLKSYALVVLNLARELSRRLRASDQRWLDRLPPSG